MRNLFELWMELRRTPTTEIEKRKELSFEIITLYGETTNDERRVQKNVEAVSGAALVLSGMKEKGLAEKVKGEVKKYRKVLPHRAVELLESNYLRMAGY